ncbi:efflux RND transporter periplasmic adaptor subunit [Ulvibacter litoralis]|uniref:Membrane fusion protein, cobalt-zinc-cadmium efflux system n=1 Tax=Ulvibacter litoralis TaxID=227084 RepID=A0A1G7FLH6_9FLAO|nr:efflux RND transporter periplasmic adaptor subunit [Ulvibacter litoralis]GHC50674.1 hemolysin D [Ulvibacter litoralis]SDE76730.1 membrane fusion protein, cobalt-zinc-cadmium efflux system [Ulvibacter litoralis]
MQRIIYKIAILSAVIALFSCGNKEVNTKQADHENEASIDERIFVSKAQFEHSKMTLGTLEEKSFPITVTTTGMIDVPPENRAVVNATMGGYIKTTSLLIGDKVRKGQPLVTIENTDFVAIQQEYMEIHEQLTYLKSEFERQKTMRAENITSQKSFLQAESAYKTALARYNGLRKQLQLLNISPTSVETGTISSVVTIYSPIAGSITKMNVTRGTYVSPATAILEIINNDHIHLELSVFEKDVMKLKKGQVINFKIPESSTEIYKAEVHLLGTAIEENRTIKVHGHIENESEANFLTGMFVEAEIVTESEDAKALPETAIIAFEDSNVVLKLVESTPDGYYFEQVAINVGSSYDGYTALTSLENLLATDTVLSNGAFNLVADE